MIKKDTDKHINKVTVSPNRDEIWKLHFALLLISLGEYN